MSATRPDSKTNTDHLASRRFMFAQTQPVNLLTMRPVTTGQPVQPTMVAQPYSFQPQPGFQAQAPHGFQTQPQPPSLGPPPAQPVGALQRHLDTHLVNPAPMPVHFYADSNAPGPQGAQPPTQPHSVWSQPGMPGVPNPYINFDRQGLQTRYNSKQNEQTLSQTAQLRLSSSTAPTKVFYGPPNPFV